VKWSVKLVLCFLIAWLPLAGFAAPARLCPPVSSPVHAPHNAAQHSATRVTDMHADGSSSMQHQTACHGSADLLCGSVFAVPAEMSAPDVAVSSSVYNLRNSALFSQFIPDLPQRPPQVL
jgi:hypothetical protein